MFTTTAPLRSCGVLCLFFLSTGCPTEPTTDSPGTTVSPIPTISSKSITDVSFGAVHRYNSSSSHFMAGDTFGNCWAANGATYFTMCDVFYGWNGAELSANLDINILPDDPLSQDGRLVNAMDFLGGHNELTEDPDGLARAWKGGPMLSDGGVLYVMVDRQQYAWQEDNPLYPQYQVAAVADFLMSEDNGHNWVDHEGNRNVAPPVGDAAMFTSPSFNQPYFIEHGKDNAFGPSTYRADVYVYAASFDKWPNGDFMTLGRVRKDAIMNPSQWQVYSGPVPSTRQEGLDDANWSFDHDRAAYLIYDPGKVNYGDVKYDVNLGKYLYFGYYYPDGYTNADDEGRLHSNYRFYQSDAPWGPWTPICDTPTPGGFYIPTAPSKWFSEDGKQFKIIAAGPWDTAAMDPALWNETTYTMYIQDVTLTTD